MLETPRSRRTHQKSRKGCIRCKSRHVKCDETHPSCKNCLNLELICTYHGSSTSPKSPCPPTPAASDYPSSSSASVVHSPPAPTPPVVNDSPPARNDVLLHPAPGPREFSMLHLALLHHASHALAKDFGGPSAEMSKSIDSTIKIAFDAPFLMFEVLALSALHLSTLHPNQQEFYTNEAADLQTRALIHFNSLPDTYKSATSIPIFLFSAYIGLHTLFDTLRFRPSDFGHFIDRFVVYLRLHRGTCTLANGTFQLLAASENQDLIPGGLPSEAERPQSNNECVALKALVRSADLSQSSVNACLQAIDLLQWTFDTSRPHSLMHVDGSGGSAGAEGGGAAGVGQVNTLFAWPITVRPEFTTLILQRKPEALAILAHYGVLLHQRRHLWIIRDGGEYLIGAIVQYLGSYWEHWLTLPMSILQKK